MDNRRLEESSGHVLGTLGRRIKLPFVNELRLGRKPSDQLQAEAVYTNAAIAPLDDNEAVEVIKDGVLSKTTITYKGETPKVGMTRLRHFRLTEGAIEYFHQFSLVKVKRRFPLTSIEKVEYKAANEPTIFRLIFSNYIEILQAETPEEASDWAEKIKTECRKWCPLPSQKSILDDLSLSHLYEEVEEEEEEEIGEREGSKEEGEEEQLPTSTTELAAVDETAQDPATQSLDVRNEARFKDLLHVTSRNAQPARAHPLRNRRFTTPTLRGWRKRNNQKIMEDLNHRKKSTAKTESDIELGKNFRMIKYPRQPFRLPSDQYFKLDLKNMQIMWRRNQHTRFQRSKSLSLHKVVEVRKGQRTHMFDKFPYEQATDQSFSLIYEQEDKWYARLTALDVICDYQSTYDTWINELESKVVHGQHQGFCSAHPKMSNEESDTTDTTILWLRQIWSCKSENDGLSESTAIKLVKKLNPFVPVKLAKTFVACSYQNEVEPSREVSLGFEGFVLMFNLLNNITNSRLYTIFEDYAKTFPRLGLTIREFRDLLVQECGWRRRDCKKNVLQKLMKTHDSYHQAYKKYVARNKSNDFVKGHKLLSFAGFLSFLRSQDNSAIDPEHETVYQDMTQPLSHYFINSSHNTYLEGDQIQGKSSTDAYVRTFLQGCRCVEIDCWNDTLNVMKLAEREPVIYHGYTLTTKIPFWEVILAIKEYGFLNSDYPVIISIENHCNQAHQKKMAKIFKAIFSDMLPDRDLVKEEKMDRLPSPKDLQKKIILKGSFKNKEDEKQSTGFRQMLASKMTSTKSSVPGGETSQFGAAASGGPSRSQESSIKPSSSATESPSASATSRSFFSAERSTGFSVIEGEDIEMAPDLPLATDSREPERADSLDGGVASRQTSTDHTDSETDHSAFIESESFVADNQHSTLDRFSHSLTLKNICRIVARLEEGQDDQELEFITTLDDLKRLIIYAKSISIKPWSWEKQKMTAVTEMFSFGEPKAKELCSESSKEMLACTERQLVRTYPKGIRFDSSNYNPLQMWNCGIQMVSLNFQYPDSFMHLNQGMFRRNGGCGYILKPAIMRRENPGEGSTPFDPNMKVPHPDVPPLDLEIELLSGQRLCPWKKKRSSVSVKIHTYGITNDFALMPEANHINVLWPYWGRDQYVLKKTILMPELCLVYFRVETDRKLFGQNCIPVVSLMPGLKFIPLRTPGGELIPGSGLFVKIKKREAIEPAARPTITKDEAEAGEDDKALEASNRISQIGKQESVDLDDWDQEEDQAGGGELDKEEANEETDKETTTLDNAFEIGGEENKLIEEEEEIVLSSVTRRFTSPASLDNVSEFLSITNPQHLMTTVAEVHEYAD